MWTSDTLRTVKELQTLRLNENDDDRPTRTPAAPAGICRNGLFRRCHVKNQAFGISCQVSVWASCLWQWDLSPLFFSKATLRPGRHRNCNPLLMANELLKAEVSSVSSGWQDRRGHRRCRSSRSVVPRPFHFVMLRLGSWLCRLAAVPTGSPPRPPRPATSSFLNDRDGCDPFQPRGSLCEVSPSCSPAHLLTCSPAQALAHRRDSSGGCGVQD
ncbi:uncharacterized protein LOC111097899 isoform X4 [Canis lupus familiaris]|uniref:uncharacterized protein LOC111097899 isoform X4 n=1 Tax=Canis lupus familiaris TaxID=9615 RepID=UPI0018F33ED5|nr:uncharacterized protein LOC111097899 isoform X4 [Canis lupus familiaris]